jgi:hypothetical protein
LAWLASSHQSDHGSGGVPRQAARRSVADFNRRFGFCQTERKESNAACRPVSRSPQLGITVPAIRHLFARALMLKSQTRQLLFRWAGWRINHNQDVRNAHYPRRLNPQL